MPYSEVTHLCPFLNQRNFEMKVLLALGKIKNPGLVISYPGSIYLAMNLCSGNLQTNNGRH
jgi:hypothetical protein